MPRVAHAQTPGGPITTTRRAFVVCGPTASGKSDVADAVADALTEARGASSSRVATLVVDSMQVYRELPVVTNQARRRPAELVGVVPVTQEWTVARHREAARAIVSASDAPFVLDAGTGMYLNAVLLDVPLAPKVDPETRRIAQEATAGAENPRRAARARELELAGAGGRRSIWDGYLLYDTTMIYLRPERHRLDAAVARRSEKIAAGGLPEARTINGMLLAGAPVRPSVLDAIGVRELLQQLSGEIPPQEAAVRIAARTRKLARRQMRWFDKLARTVKDRATVTVAESPATAISTFMHGIIGA